MQTRSGIPLDEIAPDAPDLRAAVAAVLANAHTYSDSRVGTVPKELIHALRATYEATPEPAPAITDQEREIIGRVVVAEQYVRSIGGMPMWADADLAVLARLAGRT